MRKLADDIKVTEKQLYPIPKVESKQIQQTLDLFFLYLTQCIHQSVLEKSDCFQEFLEISAINHQGHKKFKECFMIKKAGGRSNESRCVRCGVFWGRWNRRYLCITSDGVSISKGRDVLKCEIREMIMFDYDFSVEYGMQDTGYSKGIRLNSSNRKLTLEAPTLFQFFNFLLSLKEAIEESPYLGTHRFASFSPLRQKNSCKWYVDGEGYFKDVYKYIKKAQHEIFITDWWLAPQFHLVRPITEDNQLTRLDLLLKKKASEKVKIFIIVYREPKLALNIDSHYTKFNLMGMHPNIKVIRHPKTLIPFMWSHHEKIVVVDQKVGFLGGLDICYGRMDNQNHYLFDEAEQEGKGQFWPGIDFSNGRTKDYQNVKDHLRGDIDRNKDARLPWHDVAMRVVGDGVIDMSRHFIQYWNFALADLELKQAKNNKFVLRTRQADSQQNNQNEDKGFLNKLKKQWKKFRESSVIGDNRKSDDEEQKQDLQKKFVNDQQQQEYLITSDNQKQPPHLSFQKQNQHDLYFNQLIRHSHMSHSRFQGTKSFHSSHIKTQNQDKPASQIPANAIDEKYEEEESKLDNKPQPSIHKQDNQIDLFKQQSQPSINKQDNQIDLFKQQLSNISKSEDNKNITVSSIPKQQQQQHQNRIFLSEFPTLQSKTSDQYQSPELPSNIRVRSHSTDNQQHHDCLEQQFLELLQEVRNDKDEDVQKGFYESQDNNENEATAAKIKKRKNSEDSDSSIGSVQEDQQDIILDNKKVIHSSNGKADCQMVRSSSLWSCGVKETECSIHIAYIQLIGQAQNFIYIENQFFISGMAGYPVKNSISQALVSRIKQAHINNEPFRVVVVVPLLPGFEGEIDGNSGVMKVQLHWEYQTICRGGNSIYETLQMENIPNPDRYISFYGLRTHAQKEGQQPISEIVYVHSKLMIVDDRVVIMGSANINDRSMKGSRDSEIAMVVEDSDTVETMMGGLPYQASKFAYTLRQTLFQEHFGLKDVELVDPLDNDLFEKMQTNSKKNTWIYREVFRCYPDDAIKISSDYEEFKKKRDLSKYSTLKDQITGFAVEFPRRFLEDEDLRLRKTQKEYYCPDINFT